MDLETAVETVEALVVRKAAAKESEMVEAMATVILDLYRSRERNATNAETAETTSDD